MYVTFSRWIPPFGFSLSLPMRAFNGLWRVLLIGFCGTGSRVSMVVVTILCGADGEKQSFPKNCTMKVLVLVLGVRLEPVVSRCRSGWLCSAGSRDSTTVN